VISIFSHKESKVFSFYLDFISLPLRPLRDLPLCPLREFNFFLTKNSKFFHFILILSLFLCVIYLCVLCVISIFSHKESKVFSFYLDFISLPLRPLRDLPLRPLRDFNFSRKEHRVFSLITNFLQILSLKIPRKHLKIIDHYILIFY